MGKTIFQLLAGAVLGAILGAGLAAYLGPETIADVKIAVGSSQTEIESSAAPGATMEIREVTRWRVEITNRLRSKFPTTYFVKCRMSGKQAGIDSIPFDQSGRIPSHQSLSDRSQSSGLRRGVIFETTLGEFGEKDLVVLRVRGDKRPRCEQVSALSWNP